MDQEGMSELWLELWEHWTTLTNVGWELTLHKVKAHLNETDIRAHVGRASKATLHEIL